MMDVNICKCVASGYWICIEDTSGEQKSEDNVNGWGQVFGIEYLEVSLLTFWDFALNLYIVWYHQK